jgi:hypothetical protein
MIAVGDVWNFALEQTLFGQVVINTFALKVTSTSGTVSETNFMANAWRNFDAFFTGTTSLSAKIRALQTNQVVHRAWHVQRVAGILSASFVHPFEADTTGEGQGDAETANVALSIERKGLAAGRRSRGRIAIAGSPTTEMAQGRFSSPHLITANDVAAKMIGTGATSDLTQFQLGFWSPLHTVTQGTVTTTYAAQFTHCIVATPKSTVRVQRSRTVDVGS